MGKKRDTEVQEFSRVFSRYWRKIPIEELIAELNMMAVDGELITRKKIKAAREKIKRFVEMIKSPNGKCRVIGVSKISNKVWIRGEYDTPEEALEMARKLTEEAKPLAIHPTLARVYYAYDSKGRYLGGDTWVGE